MTYYSIEKQGAYSMTLEQQITAEENFYFDDHLSNDELYDLECEAADEYNDDKECGYA